MKAFGNLIELRATSGEPIVVGNVSLTPQARAMTVRLPFGAFVWNQPTGVIVARDGTVERVPIVDVTQRIVIALTAFTLVVAMAWARRSRQKEKTP